MRNFFAFIVLFISVTAQAQRPYPYLLGNTKSILDTSFCAKYECRLLHLKDNGEIVSSLTPRSKDSYQITEIYQLNKFPGVAISIRRVYQSKDKVNGFLVNIDLYPFFDIKNPKWWENPDMKTINKLNTERFNILKDFQGILYSNYVLSGSSYTPFYWRSEFYKDCYSQVKKETENFSGGNALVSRATIQTGYPGDKVTYKYTGSCGFDFPDYDNYPFTKAVLFVRWSLVGY